MHRRINLLQAMLTSNPDESTEVKAPLKSEIKTLRILIFLGIISVFFFLNWFINPEHIGYAPIFWLLTFALAFKLAKMLHEWYHYWNPSITPRPLITKQLTVDVFTTSCPGEPREMIIRTLKAMKNISYPHTNYLCDEGNDYELKKICDELGIVHVTRIDKTDAKAGNINNALKQATGDICLILDPDHVPAPHFLDRVIPYFEDKKVGYVQCVQSYGNQSESFIARGAAEQTYHFYGPMMMCMNSYGTVQAIGANCTFRREALDSIGGHAPGLAEDMHTAMQLHAKGWKSVYVPEILSRGLVPATLSSYYKQQLKWSRGTFELLFRVYPKLFKNFTWRQKFHYFTIPIYFLFGLINLIDIAIPIMALSLAEVPWEVNLIHFGEYFLPVCVMSLVIRLYSQRWLLEKHERGFHFAGGILRTATWWIFLVGFVYSIFNIKVPYIPTPKEDEHQNYIKLSIPNVFVLLFCIVAIFYGLYIDWTPYSIAMASYSFMTIGMLGFTVLMSQQKFLMQVNGFCNRMPVLNFITKGISYTSNGFQQVAYQMVRKGAALLIITLAFVFFSSISLIDEADEDLMNTSKELGNFYIGTELAPNNPGEQELIQLQNSSKNALNVVSFTHYWNKDGKIFPVSLMNAIRNKAGIPFITWRADEHDDIIKNNLYSDIISGKYDVHLKKCADLFRNYKDPVFLSFSNHTHLQSGQQFIKAWQYLYTYFNNWGISNITWVWSPSSVNEEKLYPGEKFVDWIGVNCMNYAKALNDKDWHSFSEIYKPYRDRFKKLEKPVMITGFGSVAGSGQTSWFTNALADIETKYEEIHSVILYNKEKTIITKTDSSFMFYVADFNLKGDSKEAVYAQMNSTVFKTTDGGIASGIFNTPQKKYKSRFVNGTPGKYNLLIHQKPYYIKGVAYNTAHDWRDGNMPLTRRQIEKDFRKIKDMGANTIRRYGLGIYDRNVLNIAAEYKLNVLYGFWFDPKIDFYKDSLKVKEYIKEVEERVMRYKDHPAIIGWSLGNESWGLLKHKFAKPYLTKVRNAYIQLIEHLAQRIHTLDPTRPVFSCIEHEEYQLPGELVAFHDGAPSVDVIGINSYYKGQISKLNQVAWQFDSLRPYLVSEFGPSGYWDPKYNKTENNSVIEESDSEKSDWYKQQWVLYVNGYKGYNVGGFAYCWHDRMEGSYTWFGLTDFKGRPKPSYYALKEQWTKIKQEEFPQFRISSQSQLIPGKEYVFSAVTENKIKSDLKYEWRLLKNEYLEQVDEIEVSDNPAVASVTIPDEPSNYRLYLFVTDKNNQWVTTASVPIHVAKKTIR